MMGRTKIRHIHSYVYIAVLMSTFALFIAVSWSRRTGVILSSKVKIETSTSSKLHPPREGVNLFNKVKIETSTSSKLHPPREGVNLFNKVKIETSTSSKLHPPREAEEMMKDFQLNSNSQAWRMEIPEKRPDFQAVSGLGSILYVHAALWKGDNVRISVFKLTYPNETNILCVLWYSSDKTSNFSVANASVSNLMNFAKNATGAYLKCPTKAQGEKQQFNQSPLYVGLVHAKNLTAGVRIVLPVENRHMNPDAVFEEDITVTASKASDKVRDEKSGVNLGKSMSNLEGDGQDNNTQKAKTVDFTVCIPPMFKYNNAAQLVEKLEMVRLLGARRVVLYKFYVRQNVDAVLDMYTREWAAGRETMEVIVHSWNVPQIHLHYRGQLLAVDDCLHRYGWLSRYVVFDDIDELMIPLRHANWSELIEERARLHPNSAAFMFRCSIMNNDHLSIAKGFQNEASRFGSSVFSLTQRDDFVWSPLKKSKVIVDPRKVESMSVHVIDKGYGPTDTIPPDLGLLYHYRWPFRLCASEVKDDRVATKFGKQLVRGLKSAWANLKDVQLGWKRPLPATNTTRPSCAVKAKPMGN